VRHDPLGLEEEREGRGGRGGREGGKEGGREGGRLKGVKEAMGGEYLISIVTRTRTCQ
jgi:hypothetical protein